MIGVIKGLILYLLVYIEKEIYFYSLLCLLYFINTMVSLNNIEIKV